jgi:two-component system sensor histidine kinase KdpD
MLRRALTSRPGRRTLLGAAGAIALLAIAVACLLPLRDRLDSGSVALILLVPPLVAASGGLGASVGVAIASGLAFNVFFTRPYESLRIESSTSVAALIVYVCVALTLSILAARLREARALADRRARNASLLGGLAVEMIRQGRLEAPLRSALRDLVETLELRGASIEIVNGHGERVAVERGTLDLPGELVPVATGDAAYGSLRVDPGPERELDAEARRLLDSFAGVVALAAARSEVEEQAVRRRTLEESDRLRRALLQSVSHDLRTPLTAIRTIAAALRGAELETGERDAMLADVEHEATRLSRLVSDLLELSRVEAGALRPARVPVPVEELCRAALDDARLALGAHEVELEIEPRLPPVEIDETMLRQVLVNLLENAAIHDEGPLRLRALRAGGSLELRVVDHGPGVPEAERERIFEAFQRLRGQLAGRDRGTGLGLAIARGFVEAHGGTIRVETSIGGGATFVVSLPLAGGLPLDG